MRMLLLANAIHQNVPVQLKPSKAVWGTAGLGASAHLTASLQQKALGWHYRTADVVAASSDLLASAAKALQGKEFTNSRTGPRPGL